MQLRNLKAETVVSIYSVSAAGLEQRLGTQPSDIRWFLSNYADEEIEPLGDGYIGKSRERFRVLIIQVRPRQDPITACGKFASSSVATFRS